MARAAAKKTTVKRRKKPAPKKKPARASRDWSGTIVGQVLAATRGLRASFENQMKAGYGEERLLAYVVIACLLTFIAGIPGAMRDQIFHEDGQFLPRIVAMRFVATMFFAPLFYYGVAAVSHIVSVWTFGGKGDYFRARVSFFWSLILAVPIIFVQAILFQLLDLYGLEGQKGIVTGIVVLIWLWIWSTGIAVAEGFSRIATFLFILAVVVVLFGLTLLISG